MEKEITTNKMGVQSINKLMFSMGMPMIFSMMLQAFYNIVDSYFISNMKGTGEYGVNALTLCFPVQMLMVAIGVGTGLGANTILSRNLGQGNFKKANKIAGNAIFLSIFTYIVFLLFGLFGVNSFLSTQTTDKIALKMANQYLTICCTFSFGIIINMIFEKLLQATGKTNLSTISQIVGALTNIILDPILIFGLLGFPKMGIRGAAWATVIGQILSLICGITFHFKFNKEVDSNFKYIKPNLSIIKEIYQVGFPAIIMNALMSFMAYGVNLILGRVSNNLITAYGIFYKIQQFVFYGAFGMVNAIIPITAYNYGMKDNTRVNKSIKIGLIYNLVIMGGGAIILELFAKPIVGIFGLSPETSDMCIMAIKIICTSYLFAAANITYQGVFQALGFGFHSLIISALRLIVLTLPLIWVFTLFSNAKNLVWLAFPIAEFISLIIALIMLRNIKKKLKI